ncbi:hypothetical protein [Methanolapillus ohkumae]
MKRNVWKNAAMLKTASDCSNAQNRIRLQQCSKPHQIAAMLKL